MDDYDEDMDDFADELDEDGIGYDDDSDDYNDEEGFSDEVDDDRLRELEELGSMDGQQDGISGSFYTGYGMSVEDFDTLSDEEKNAYESGYYSGFDASGGKI